MRALVLAALATASLAATGMGDAARAEDDLVYPVYSKRADLADIKAAYPKDALAQKITGDVVLDCAADASGNLVDCQVREENPAGLGFGQAALGLAAKERVKAVDRDGAPIAGRRFKRGVSFLAPGDANPDWMRKPTASDLAGVFPTAAAKKRIDGSATIACRSSEEGFLQRCKVVSETPDGLGFGAAALQLAPQFRMTPKIRGGKPVPAEEVTIPINWRGFTNYHAGASDLKSLVLDPPWTRVPTLDQVRAAWPAGAKDRSGQAALRCQFNKTGGLSACETISEIPAGRGFAKAARALTGSFAVRFDPAQVKDMRSISVDVPFRFRDPAEPDGRRMTNPTWVRHLTPEGMAAIYPKAAQEAGIKSGLGVVACVIDGQGALTDCETRREEPAGMDFGAAAVTAAKLMSINPWSKEGEPQEGLKIVLPIRFEWQEPTNEEPAPAAKP